MKANVQAKKLKEKFYWEIWWYNSTAIFNAPQCWFLNQCMAFIWKIPLKNYARQKGESTMDRNYQ